MVPMWGGHGELWNVRLIWAQIVDPADIYQVPELQVVSWAEMGGSGCRGGTSCVSQVHVLPSQQHPTLWQVRFLAGIPSSSVGVPWKNAVFARVCKGLTQRKDPSDGWESLRWSHSVRGSAGIPEVSYVCAVHYTSRIIISDTQNISPSFFFEPTMCTTLPCEVEIDLFFLWTAGCEMLLWSPFHNGQMPCVEFQQLVDPSK